MKISKLALLGWILISFFCGSMYMWYILGSRDEVDTTEFMKQYLEELERRENVFIPKDKPRFKNDYI